jgi:predicted AAA+ superfamily ATPase
MRAVCLRLGQLMNQAELGRDVAVPLPTVHRWLNLLETSYQLVRLHPYAVNRTKRIIKTPKVYWADTGLALHLAGLGEPAGGHLENLVLNDLLAWRDVRLDRPAVLYWRTATGEEVDFIEVKATARPRVGDAKHLRTFREEYGRHCRPGLVLHTGDAIEWLAPGVLAAPWWKGAVKASHTWTPCWNHSACSIRVSISAFVRIERIGRNRESVKFFVFNGRKRFESHPLRHIYLP